MSDRDGDKTTDGTPGIDSPVGGRLPDEPDTTQPETNTPSTDELQDPEIEPS